MKKVLLSAVSLVVLTGSALAADLPSRKAPVLPPPPPPPMWTGFYAGLNIGGGWSAGGGNGNAWNLGGMNGGVTNNIGGGVIGGGQIGYNYQLGGAGLPGIGGIGGGLGGIVIGAEADFQGTSMSQTNTGYGVAEGVPGVVNGTPIWYQSGKSLPWFGTVRGRLGILAMPTLLLYGTGGFAYADVQNNGGLYGTNRNSATQTGWTAGGGAEWMFMPNWSAKVEYLYTDVSGGNQNTWFNLGTGINNVNNHTRWNTVRAGVNYHFNWGAAPVVAKY